MANFLRFLPIAKTAVQSAVVRSFASSAVKCDSSKISSNLHKVNNLEKKFLVWTGKFKTVADVPNVVPSEVVEKARSRMRIRIANIMMGLTLVACLLVTMSGKAARDRGDSVQKRNLEWHRQVKEDAERKESST